MLGRMWRVTIRQSLAPRARAASTNSFSLAASICARTSRAYPTQPPRQRARVRLEIPSPKKCTKADRQKDAGKRKNGFNRDAAEDPVSRPAVVAGNRAENEAQQERSRHHAAAHQHGNAGAVDHAGENVAPQFVGP